MADNGKNRREGKWTTFLEYTFWCGMSKKKNNKKRADSREKERKRKEKKERKKENRTVEHMFQISPTLH